MRKRKGGLLKKINDFLLSDFMLGFWLGIAVLLNVFRGLGYIN